MTSLSKSATQKINDLSQRWTAFPNLEVVGRYEYFSQSIHVPTVEKEHADKSKESNDFVLKRKTLGVFIHELTHWLDHTSTLWGHGNLVRLYQAVDARLHGSEPDLWRIPLALADNKRTHFNEYYTEYGPAVDAGRPWLATYTCGREYGLDGRVRNDRPVVFVRFSAPTAGLAVRAPLSVAALLETRAVYAELRADSKFISKLDKDERIVTEKIWQTEMLDRLYTARHAAYTVAAHVVSNYMGSSDVFDTFKCSSFLAGIALNLPSSLFGSLRRPDALHPWRDIIPHMISGQNRGYAFLVMAMSLPKGEMDFDERIRLMLKAAGLPDAPELHTQILGNMLALSTSAHLHGQDRAQRLRRLLSIGYGYQGTFGPAAAPYLANNAVLQAETKTILPPIILGDGHLLQYGLPLPKECEVSEEWVTQAWDDDQQLQEFFEACLP